MVLRVGSVRVVGRGEVAVVVVVDDIAGFYWEVQLVVVVVVVLVLVLMVGRWEKQRTF